MKTLHMTIGLPRSGKSTWARSKISEGYAVVNPDSIRLAVHGTEFDKAFEPMVWRTARVMAESLFIAGHDNVILDATGTVTRLRREWFSSNWKVVYHCFMTPTEVCLSRITEQNQYLIPVIKRMNRQLHWAEVNEDAEENGIKVVYE